MKMRNQQKPFLTREPMKRFLIASLMTALMAVSVSAHARTGSIHGVVSSTTGAVIAQAQVIITNRSTCITQITLTDEDGAYAVNELTPGDYEVRAEAPGFHPDTQPATVEPDGRVTLDFCLEPQTDGEPTASGEDSDKPGTSVRTHQWTANLNLTSLFPTRVLPLPFNLRLGGSYTSTFNPNGILLPTQNEYVEDESGMTDRLRQALRSTRPDGER